MTESQPSHWTHHGQAYALILARWAGDDAAMDALPPEQRMAVIRALIDKLDSQRRLAQQSRHDFLDEYATEIAGARTIAGLEAEMAEHLTPESGWSGHLPWGRGEESR